MESGEIGEKHLAHGTQVLLELNGKSYPVTVMGTDQAEVRQRKDTKKRTRVVESDSEEEEDVSSKVSVRSGKGKKCTKVAESEMEEEDDLSPIDLSDEDDEVITHSRMLIT